jgi:transcriptional regulator with XRE-family HTH domain
MNRKGNTQTHKYVAKRRIEIGSNIRGVRRSRGLSQEDVAHRLGCSRKRINRVEQGHIELSIGEMELLAQALNTHFHKLIGLNVEELMPKAAFRPTISGPVGDTNQYLISFDRVVEAV